MIKFEELNWKQLDAMDKNKTIFFLPISPMEEHGPHLPLGTDFFTAEDMAVGAIKLLNDKNPDLNCILMPSIPLGSCRVTSDFPGTISLKGRTIKNVIYGVGSSLAKWKFKYILICNFHMDLAHVKAIRMGMKKVERKYGIKIYEPSSPYFYNKLVQAKERVNFDTIADLHACFRETSLMMETHPYLLDNCYKKLPKVAINTERPSALWKTLKEMGASNGYIGNPSKAKKDYGKWLLKELVEWHAKCVIDMLDNKEMLDLPKKMKWIMKLFVRL